MSTLLDFNFLTILNLFALLLWPSSVSLFASPDAVDRRRAISIIVTIITVIVVFGDIVFLVLKMTGH